MRLHSTVLAGPNLTLTPVSSEDAHDYTRAALSAPEVWRHIPYPMQSSDDVAHALQRAAALHAAGTALVFATRLAATGEIIGGTTILLIDGNLPSVEIGGTWIVPRWQRTHVNTEAKLLQLTHCFEVLGCERCEFKTDILNLRSRAAIARLGAIEEGTLRAQRRRVDGSLRDSVLFSIIAREWPQLKAGLQAKLARPSSASA